jgi:hypothetical protein
MVVLAAIPSARPPEMHVRVRLENIKKNPWPCCAATDMESSSPIRRRSRLMGYWDMKFTLLLLMPDGTARRIFLVLNEKPSRAA